MPETTTNAGRPGSLFPLVRHISGRVTPLLYRSPLSANQVTLISLVLGLAASYCMADRSANSELLGGLLLVGCYILDNCDGEIARLKSQCSEFGRRFDNFVDWAVHTAFFAALGWGVGEASGEQIWIWLGAIAALGSTVNYAIGTIAEERESAERQEKSAEAAFAKRPETWWQWIVFAFRELSRADFCFIVLGLAIFEQTWVLLPLGAAGAQAFWIAHLLPDARSYHV